MLLKVLRIALAIGFVVDFSVAMLALFFQSALGPLLDIPLKDPAATTIAGGEFVVVHAICAGVVTVRMVPVPAVSLASTVRTRRSYAAQANGSCARRP